MLEDYLLRTWHPDTRPVALDLKNDARIKWLGLEVKRHETTGADTAIVEFVARYKHAGKAGRMHEKSRFMHLDGYWYYLDGNFPA